MYAWIALLVLFIILTFSIWQRIKYFRQALDNCEIKVSPFSLAIQELIAISGGIYLSLILLVSFLKISIPDKVLIFEFSIDPLACTALGLTLIQPLFLKILNIIKIFIHFR